MLEKCWACGPYQIKKEYFDDACWADTGNPPTEECRNLCQNFNWEDLCEPCTGTLDQILQCCERKKNISETIMKCYWRRHTRNGNCQDGNGCEPGPNNANHTCFTCIDLAMQHNGGPCGHKGRNKDVRDYANDIRELLCDVEYVCTTPGLHDTECKDCCVLGCAHGPGSSVPPWVEDSCPCDDKTPDVITTSSPVAPQGGITPA